MTTATTPFSGKAVGGSPPADAEDAMVVMGSGSIPLESGEVNRWSSFAEVRSDPALTPGEGARTRRPQIVSGQCGRATRALAHPRAEAFTFRSRHALGSTAAPASTPSAEQNPAQGEQPEALKHTD